jgi:hypothetical protein
VGVYCECRGGEQSKFCKAPGGKPLFTALYGMHSVTLNELKAVLKVSAEEGQSDAANKISVESTVQDDAFQEVKRRMRHISNNTSQTGKNSTKAFPRTAAASKSSVNS